MQKVFVKTLLLVFFMAAHGFALTLADNKLDPVVFPTKDAMKEFNMSAYDRTPEKFSNAPDKEGTVEVRKLMEKLYYNTHFDSEKAKIRREIIWRFETGVDINGISNLSEQQSFLHKAVDQHDMELAKYLLSKGAKVDSINFRTETPLTCAVEREKPDFDMIELLLEYNANIQLRCLDGAPIVVTAGMYSRNPDLVRFLLDRGADINDQGMLRTNLVSSIARPKSDPVTDDVTGYLIAQGAEFEKKTSNGYFVSGMSMGGMGPHGYSATIPESALMIYANLPRHQAVIRSVYCHSWLAWDEQIYMYHPSRIFDGDPATGWLDGEKDSGIGKGFGISLDRKITVDEIRVAPGYFDSQWFADNNRVKKLEISLNGKKFDAVFKDEMKMQSFKLPTPVAFNNAFFIVGGVYRAKASNDTAISEIQFFRKGMQIRLHTGMIGKYLRKISQKEVMAELQKEIFTTSYSGNTDITGKPPEIKLTQAHFTTLLDILKMPASSITWKDSNDNGVAEIGELASMDRQSLKTVWDFSGRVAKDCGLSIFDYCAEILNAISEGNADKMNALMTNQIDLGFRDVYQCYQADKSGGSRYNGSSYLTVAASTGNIPVLEKFTELGLDINECSRNLPCLLYWALNYKQDEAVHWLVENGADVNMPNGGYGNLGLVPLFHACHDIEMVKYLIANGADIHAEGSGGETLLHWAAQTGSLELVKFFKNKGLDLYARDKLGQSAAIFSAYSGKDEKLLLYLIDNDVDCSYVNKQGQTLLSHVARLGWFDAASALLTRVKLSPDGSGGEYAPLFQAISNSNIMMAALLLKNGANPNIQRADGWTPFFSSVNMRNIEMIKLLLANGADVSFKDKSGNGIMYWAENLKWQYRNQNGDLLDKLPQEFWTIKSLLLDAGAEPAPKQGL
jgi:ankyrin repeat protein